MNLINWIKYRNSYLIYSLNKLYFKIKEFYIKNKYGEKELLKFKKKQNECIWCKRIYVKKIKNVDNRYFCCKKCENLYREERYLSIKHNNRCKKHSFKHRNCILTFKNECWQCYKEKFIKEKIYTIKKFKIKYYISFLLHGFKIYPTFRTSTDGWKGDKPAFEQILLDNNINWFVYIKFYNTNEFNEKKNKIRPIIVGKSGSLNVNSTGSDLNFSTSNNDGAARKFVNLNNFTWNCDFIMIKKVKSEDQAFYQEKKIMEKFDLFGS